MAPERQVKSGILSGMTTKQKAMAGVIVFVILVIIWQVMGLMGGSSSSGAIEPVTTPVPKKTSAAMNANAPKGGAVAAINQPAQVNAANPQAAQLTTQEAAAQQPMVREGTLSMDNQILELQKKTEEKYVDQLNQLQMLRVQREIAETNQAIASARLATVTAEKNVSDLLTKPSQPILPLQQQQLPPPQMPSGTYDNTALGGQPSTPPTTEVVPPPPATTVQIPLPPVEVPYFVVSVSMQFGRWSAVLGYQGKLYNISVGDVLPVDRSVVASINKNGVVLVKGKKRRKISIITAI
jgi:hypothetical protein